MLYRDDHIIVTKNEGKYVIIGWNWHDMRDHQPSPDETYALSLPSLGQQAFVLKEDVGGAHANPLQTWSNLGKPRNLNKDQLKLLQASAEPCRTDAKLFEQNGIYEIALTIPWNHLCMLEITPVDDKTDTYPGYDPVGFNGLK